MPQNMPKLGAVLMAAVIAAWVGVWVPPAIAKPALVEVTGQTECFDTFGILIDCSSTAGAGQDGDLQAGVPFPTPRFSDKGNGTVKDNLTNLIWLKNANCFGGKTWQDALNAANNLADDPASMTTDCGLRDGSLAGDWRLPNVKELQSLIHFGFFDPALSNAKGTDKWTEGNAFSGVQSGSSWSSTTRADNPVIAWRVVLSVGFAGEDSKGATGLVWPVRGENRGFNTLRLWTLWGVQGGFPPATPRFLAEGLGDDPLSEAAHPLP
jgi:hypothetical protein